jgi:hypothetical protein
MSKHKLLARSASKGSATFEDGEKGRKGEGEIQPVTCGSWRRSRDEGVLVNHSPFTTHPSPLTTHRSLPLSLLLAAYLLFAHGCHADEPDLEPWAKAWHILSRMK